jgi:DNA-binding SARP family transcriptional activator
VQVLVFLALHPGGVDSGELTAAVWPGVRPRPVQRLYRAVSTLRTTIARGTGVQILIRTGDRYRLDHTQLHIDLADLQASIDTAAVTTDAHTGSNTLRRIIAIYTGEVAAGQPWPWITPIREAVRRHVIDAYTTLAAQAADPATAAALLDQALTVDPVNEALYRQAARAHAAAGEPDQLPVLLARLTQHLAELGDQPQPDTGDHPDAAP